jgi:hypothetical protein
MNSNMGTEDKSSRSPADDGMIGTKKVSRTTAWGEGGTGRTCVQFRHLVTLE